MAALADTILITGANRGIGLEFVKQLVQAKNAPKNVFAGCRSPEKASDLKALAETSHHVKIVQLDISNDESVTKCVKTVSDELQKRDLGLNLLINNAGAYEPVGLPNLTRDVLVRNMDILAAGPLLLSQAFIPLLKAAASKNESKPISVGRAGVVNISSIGGSIGECTTGAGRAGYPYRMGKEGILVVAFCPGWVKTDMGGPNAALTTEETVGKMLETMGTLESEHQGGFFRRDGQAYQW